MASGAPTKQLVLNDSFKFARLTSALVSANSCGLAGCIGLAEDQLTDFSESSCCAAGIVRSSGRPPPPCSNTPSSASPPSSRSQVSLLLSRENTQSCLPADWPVPSLVLCASTQGAAAAGLKLSIDWVWPLSVRRLGPPSFLQYKSNSPGVNRNVRKSTV